MANYFSRLNFSFGNEDWKTEAEALRIKPHDRVLCITASGDRPLHVLLANPKQVIAVDGNAGQNHLLQLKCAALRQLPFQEYLAFLGASSHTQRLKILPRLHATMTDDACAYWKKHSTAIKKGVLFQGHCEKVCYQISHLMHFFRGSMLRQLFAFDCLEAQRKFVKETWDHKVWRTGFRWALSPKLMKILDLDPVLHRHTDPDLHPGVYFYQRMTHVLMHCLAKKNAFLSLFFNGIVKEEAFPLYLTQQATEVMKTRIDRLSIQTADILTYLESAPESSIDCFSLSDVASYVSQEVFVRLLRAVLRVGTPNARFCVRQFLSDRQIPDDLKPYFQRETALEKKLDQEDTCCWARFMVGTLNKK
jgi:S-adenosylmethionine-diacylglycerol 3-amino-3-carboxypropyl transferase